MEGVYCTRRPHHAHRHNLLSLESIDFQRLPPVKIPKYLPIKTESNFVIQAAESIPSSLPVDVFHVPTVT